MAAHLQLVCVPLAVLGISVAGGRLWSDALSYFVLFSAAVNCLWMQGTLKGTLPLSLCRAFTIGLTVLPLRIANDGFGAYDTWRYVIAYVACIGLAPIVLLSLFPAPPALIRHDHHYDDDDANFGGTTTNNDSNHLLNGLNDKAYFGKNSSANFDYDSKDRLSLLEKHYYYFYYYDYYYQRLMMLQQSASSLPNPGSDGNEEEVAYGYHHILLQICTSAALFGLSANLAFAFESKPLM
jgi:hypothetical protein